jgi:HD-GYP domain-containing protein (c-di-GMP phosphodiesterase class II)
MPRLANRGRENCVWAPKDGKSPPLPSNFIALSADMKKQVSVDQLKFGVYVNELDRPWTDTPFMYQGFVIKTMAQLDTLKKFCKRVTIDTDKGSDVAPNPFTGAARGPSVLDTIKEQVTYEETVQVTIELPAARKAQARTAGVLNEVFGSVQAGKALDAPRVRDAVTNMTDSVVRNPDAMLLLAKMKEASLDTLDRAMSVSIYMITFGRFLSLPRAQIDLLGMLGLLQDVGKLRLPPALLTKSAALNEAERKLCKSHVAHSVAILEETSGLPPELSTLAALHHERLDGSGYPKGLKGRAEIGLFGSMAGLIDSFDALTEPRPYGETMAPAAALRVFYDERESKFDGPLVEQFIQCIGTYPVGAIVELHSSEIAIVIARNPRLKLFPRVMVVLDIHRNKLKTPKIIEQAGIKRTLPKGSVDIDPSEYFL